MPLTLIKETGSGLSDANSYANVADGDAYHDGHLYAATWTGAITANKEIALVQATSLIDANVSFRGKRTSKLQALHWPRLFNINPETQELFLGNEMPKDLVKATCEMAREILVLDRTAPPQGEGVTQVGFVGTLNITFDKEDRARILTQLVRLWLSRLGTFNDQENGTGKLLRT